MQGKYLVINIHEYLDYEDLTTDLLDVINTFDCCGKNKSVDTFLKNSASCFAEKGQAVTYLVFDKGASNALVGFFTLAIKPVTVPKSFINAKTARKFERVCNINEENDTYHFAAYLIAQLGKNYEIDENERISGEELLDIAEGEIYKLKRRVGGVATFLECENDEKLLSFYFDANYKYFGTRLAVSKKTGGTTEYLQLIKTI